MQLLTGAPTQLTNILLGVGGWRESISTGAQICHMSRSILAKKIDGRMQRMANTIQDPLLDPLQDLATVIVPDPLTKGGTDYRLTGGK